MQFSKSGCGLAVLFWLIFWYDVSVILIVNRLYIIEKRHNQEG